MKTILYIIPAFIALSCNSVVFACDNVTVTPKSFYSLEGRQSCYTACDNGCLCTYKDDGREINMCNVKILATNCVAPDMPSNCVPSETRIIHLTDGMEVYVWNQICVEKAVAP